MKKLLAITILILSLTSVSFVTAQTTLNPTSGVMSKAYWDLWNPDVQARIDKDIEQNRKANAILKITDLPAGAEIRVEQVSHDFIFGANIFNFNQLGSTELNNKYKAQFGTLFNSATIPLYWKKLEMQPNRPRYREEYWDTEAYWNQVENPNAEPHWRRPAPDPIIAFCDSKGIRKHGHPITWGNHRWHHPDWIYEQFCPQDEKDKIEALGRDKFLALSAAEIIELTPVYCSEIDRLFRKHVQELTDYFGDRLDSWDVVNESAVDYQQGCLVPGSKICNSKQYGLLPSDYTFETFKLTNLLLPEQAVRNINDYLLTESYKQQVTELLEKGCKIDVMGAQMHLFDPQQCLDIANGKPIKTPQEVWSEMETISQAGLPIHLSEITITSPNNDERGREIQAIITRNLYRLWFSIEQMMGNTWWNLVDGCGAPGEPAVSGIFTRNMQPKPAYFALNELINHEWKTKLTVRVGQDGTARFRGFKGRYCISWKNDLGVRQEAEFYLKNNGDGLQTLP